MKIVRSVSAALFGVTFLAGTPSPGEAQEGLELGFRGGYSVASASVDGERTFDRSYRTGLTGGVFLNYHVGLVGLEVGAQYTQKGVDLWSGDILSQFDLTYAEFPAVVKLGLPLGALKPGVFGGAGIGFNLGCDAGDGVDCSKDIKGVEWTGIAGADLALYMGTMSFWADARYHLGLNNVIGASDEVRDLKNRHWTFQVGVAVVIEYIGGL